MITFIGADSGDTTSLSLPSFEAGDLAIVYANRMSSATPPSLPSGWTSVSTFAGPPSTRLGYRMLVAGDTTTGTWTNATSILVAIYRGADIATVTIQAGGTGISLQTNSATNESNNPIPMKSWAVFVGVHGDATNTDALVSSIPGPEYADTNRTSGTGSTHIGLADTNKFVEPIGLNTYDTGNYDTNGTAGAAWLAEWFCIQDHYRVTNAANADTIVTTGWTNPTNAYHAIYNIAQATCAPGKNSTVNSDFGFPDITSAEIPDGASIDSVKITCYWYLSASVTGGILGVQGRVSGANSGSEATSTQLTTPIATSATLGVVSLSDLRSASTIIKARVRASKGNTNNSLTAFLEAVRLEVLWSISTPLPRRLRRQEVALLAQ